MHSDDNTKVHVNKFFRRAMIFARQKKQLPRKCIFIHLPQFITKNNGVICSTEVCEEWGGIIDRTRGASGAKRKHSKSRRNSRWSINNVTSRDLIRPYPIQYNIQRERIRTYSQYGHVNYNNTRSHSGYGCKSKVIKYWSIW